MRGIQKKVEKPEVKKLSRSKKAAEAVLLPTVAKKVSRKVTKKPELKKPKISIKVETKKVQIPQVISQEKNRRSRATRPKSSARSTSVSSEKEVVFVPSTASIRLLEKVELYRLWYKDNFPTYMAATAKVGGYAFVVLGTLFASFGYLATKDVFGPAAIVCTEVECLEIADAALPPDAPIVSFLNSLPAKLTTDTDIVLRAENTGEPTFLLRHIESAERIILSPIEKMSRGEFKYLLRSNLKPGTYQVLAEARDGNTTYTFSGPTIVVPGLVDIEPAITLLPLPESSLSTSTASSSVSDNSAQIDTSDIEVEFKDVSAKSLSPLTVQVAASTDSTYLRINVGDFAPETVEVYSRASGATATNALYLGRATRVQSECILSLSALDLPHYEHQLYASFAIHDKSYQTEAASFLPESIPVTALSSESELSLLVQKIELALATSDVKNTTRQNYFSDISSTTPAFFDNTSEITFADEALLAEADSQMQKFSESINRLLWYYAAAVQGGQKYLLDLAEAELVVEYKQIARASNATASVTALETLYALRFQTLKDHVRDMEQQVGDATNNLTNRDTDSDGFSDFDELANFATDPARADTDRDGILDTVEILSGFDPTVSDISGLPLLTQNINERVFGDILKIRGVESVVQKIGSSDKTYAVINGVTIPNTYVTILSYSQGTIGIIRTNINGEFSYTLEKDLEEGDHDVVALFTDNTGNVIASSKPFRFTKTKQALVATAVVGDSTKLTAQSIDSDTLPSVVTASVAVAAFGFLLLLLSQTVQRRRREVIQKAVPAARI